MTVLKKVLYSVFMLTLNAFIGTLIRGFPSKHFLVQRNSKTTIETVTKCLKYVQS